MIGRLFSGGGGRRVEIIVGVVAAVVLFGVAGWMVWKAFAGPPLPTNVRYACINPECGHEATVDAKDAKKMPRRPVPHGITPTLVFLCPKCKQWAFHEQQRCVHCGKWYVADAKRMSQSELRRISIKYGGVVPDRCPHCGRLQFGEQLFKDMEPNKD